MKKLEAISIKTILYIVFFLLAISSNTIVSFFGDMINMTYLMIFMSVMMLVDYVWGLIHVK